MCLKSTPTFAQLQRFSANHPHSLSFGHRNASWQIVQNFCKISKNVKSTEIPPLPVNCFVNLPTPLFKNANDNRTGYHQVSSRRAGKRDPANKELNQKAN